MKNYSTPAMEAVALNVENALLQGSAPTNFENNGDGVGSVTYTWYPNGQGNGPGYTFGYVGGQWVDGAGRTAAFFGFDSSNWLNEVLGL